ncbi:MAG: hypothetical protein EBS55_13530 [Flavobacteriaceae bacterium]|jgi:hypothetical protein|nr:hypothetical protein [Flavobacteriaceae bacterium]
MNIPQLTPEELKTLQLFAYYCRSHGANNVYQTHYFSQCSRDWPDDSWHSPQIRSSIDGYDKIEDLITKLVDDESISNKFNNCEGSQRVEVEIDCVERILEIILFETVYGTEPHGSTYNLEDIESEFGEETYNEVVQLFKTLNGSEARVDFSGGGDSGYIDDFMIIDNDQVDIPKLIEDMLYSMLNRYAGWENNEGGQGSWIFYSTNEVIEFDFNYNTEEEVRIPSNYEIRF